MQDQQELTSVLPDTTITSSPISLVGEPSPSANGYESHVLERVAGSIAHSMNNALNVFAGHLSLLGEAALAEPAERPQPESARDWIARAEKGMERIRRISRALSYFGLDRLSDPTLEEVDLNAVAQHCIELFEPALSLKAKVRISLAGNLPILWSREGRVGKLLMELLLTSLDEMAHGDPDGQTLEIETSFESGDAIFRITRSCRRDRGNNARFGAGLLRCHEEASKISAEFHCAFRTDSGRERGAIEYEIRFIGALKLRPEVP